MGSSLLFLRRSSWRPQDPPASTSSSSRWRLSSTIGRTTDADEDDDHLGSKVGLLGRGGQPGVPGTCRVPEDMSWSPETPAIKPTWVPLNQVRARYVPGIGVPR